MPAALVLAGLIAVAAIALCAVIVREALGRQGEVVDQLAALVEMERVAHRNQVAELLNRVQHPRIYQPTPEQERTIRSQGAAKPDPDAELFELAGRDYGDDGPVPDDPRLEAVPTPLPVGEPEPEPA